MEGRESKDIARFDRNFQRLELAGESDAADIANLYRKAWEEYRGEFPDDLVESMQPSAEQMKEWMRQDAYFVVRLGLKLWARWDALSNMAHVYFCTWWLTGNIEKGE